MAKKQTKETARATAGGVAPSRPRKQARAKGAAKRSRRARGGEGDQPEVEEPRSEAEADGSAETGADPVPKPRRSRRAPVDLGEALLAAAATNERMNQYLLDHLDPELWNAKPTQGRTVAAIVTHVHNVRHMWLVVSAPDQPAPEKLDRRTATLGQAKTALGESFAAVYALLRRSLEEGGRVKDFQPDVAGFVAYLVSHEAHHRGQICLLARELGRPLSKDAGYGLWDWRKRWQETQPSPAAG